MDLYVGRKGQAQSTVTAQNTAKAMGSGQLEVFATPAMVALMEQAAVNSLDLPVGQSSVGASLTIKHNAATPLGANVFATAELIEIDRRRLVFTVEVRDEAGQIGTGTHERFIIDVEPFLAKAQTRKQGDVKVEGFYTVSQMITWEQTIDKSRFIGIAVPLTTVGQIEKTMHNIREEYPNARHYVYAYRLHDGFTEKSSDDGEPQGTGGRPILEILQHRNIWNVLLVVVRYFGGVLLGTGGLSRAYGGTARQLINETDLKRLTIYQIFVLTIPYELFEILKYNFDQHNWLIENEDFSEVIRLLVHVPEEEAKEFLKWVDDFTRKQVRYEDQGSIWR